MYLFPRISATPCHTPFIYQNQHHAPTPHLLTVALGVGVEVARTPGFADERGGTWVCPSTAKRSARTHIYERWRLALVLSDGRVGILAIPSLWSMQHVTVADDLLSLPSYLS
jgi:hypothetical protein